jgi:hypothetical protein
VVLHLLLAVPLLLVPPVAEEACAASHDEHDQRDECDETRGRWMRLAHAGWRTLWPHDFALKSGSGDEAWLSAAGTFS